MSEMSFDVKAARHLASVLRSLNHDAISNAEIIMGSGLIFMACDRIEALESVVEAARSLRLQFSASWEWTTEECALDRALAKLDGREGET